VQTILLDFVEVGCSFWMRQSCGPVDSLLAKDLENLTAHQDYNLRQMCES
jgi:hypothetical protein